MLGEGSHVDLNAAVVVLGEDKGFQAYIPTFQLVIAQSLQVGSCLHIAAAIGVAEGVL